MLCRADPAKRQVASGSKEKCLGGGDFPGLTGLHYPHKRFLDDGIDITVRRKATPQPVPPAALAKENARIETMLKARAAKKP